MSVKKWMPIWIGDYLASTCHLTTQQHGAYLLLLMHYWNTQKPLPDLDCTLALIARLPEKAWKKERPALEALFLLIDGKWRDPALEREIEKAAALSAKRQKLGKIGAKKRWKGAS